MSEVRKMTLLPPAPGNCQCCAVAHDPKQPHDATTLFYEFWFMQEYGRSPTWTDALTHCTPQVQSAWIDRLRSIGIDPDSTSVRGGIKTQADLDRRLANNN